VEGWGKIVAGVVLGVAGTIYATNEEARKHLPRSAREIPENVRQRFESAVSAAREASTRRREEILRDLAAHEAHADRVARQEAAKRENNEAPETTESTQEGST
jgi:predicted RNA-binding Zn ribbon-like protein